MDFSSFTPSSSASSGSTTSSWLEFPQDQTVLPQQHATFFSMPQYITAGADGTYTDAALPLYSWNADLFIGTAYTKHKTPVQSSYVQMQDGPSNFVPVYSLTPAPSPSSGSCPALVAGQRSLKRARSSSQCTPAIVEPMEARRRNTRMQIPDHITLSNVDGLITEATAAGDEQTRQDLKLVKRLRRNREAAFTSRLRKKAHTEQLEAEKRDSESTIAALKAEVALLKQRLEAATREKETMTKEKATADSRLKNMQPDLPAYYLQPYEREIVRLQGDVMALQNVCTQQMHFLETTRLADDTLLSAPTMPCHDVVTFSEDISTKTPPQTDPNTIQAASDLLLWLILLGASTATTPHTHASPTSPPARLPAKVLSAASVVLDATLRKPTSTQPKPLSRQQKSMAAHTSIPEWLMLHLAELHDDPDSHLTERGRRSVVGANAAALKHASSRIGGTRSTHLRGVALSGDVAECLRRLVARVWREDVGARVRGVLGSE